MLTTKEIKDIRVTHGLTTAKAAALVNVSPQAWRRWEIGAHRMPPGVRELLKRRLAGAAQIKTGITPDAKNLKEVRLARGLSVAECAAAVHVSPYTWWGWELVSGKGSRSMPPWAWQLFWLWQMAGVSTKVQEDMGLARKVAQPLPPDEAQAPVRHVRWPGSIG